MRPLSELTREAEEYFSQAAAHKAKAQRLLCLLNLISLEMH